MEGSPAHQGARTEGGLSLRSSSFLPSANIAGVFLWDKLCARLWGGWQGKGHHDFMSSIGKTRCPNCHHTQFPNVPLSSWALSLVGLSQFCLEISLKYEKSLSDHSHLCTHPPTHPHPH